MRKKENKNYVFALFLIFSVAMFAMAIASLSHNILVFVGELLFAAVAMMIAVMAIRNIRLYISKVLMGASRKLFRDDKRTIDDICVPLVVLGEHYEIIAANKRFFEAVGSEEEALGGNLTDFLTNDNPESVFDDNGTDKFKNEKWFIAFGEFG